MRFKTIANTVSFCNLRLANAILREEGGVIRLKKLRRKPS
jgi:hypothetical protein